MEDKKQLTPSQYFEKIKAQKEVMTKAKLDDMYENALALANKYVITEQTEHLKKLLFCMSTIPKQKELIDLGIDTYVSKDDVEDFIDNVSDDAVKIIDLKRYPREIPDEICEILPKVKNIFTSLYVVYTDYTGKTERKVAQEKRDKDPILFGVFESQKDNALVDQWYYLGDWVDEYCDLTLEKMISVMEKNDRPNILKTIEVPKNIEELKVLIGQVENKDGKFAVNQSSSIKINNTQKTSKVKTFLNGIKRRFSK